MVDVCPCRGNKDAEWECVKPLGVPENEETWRTFLLKGGVQIWSFFGKVLQAMRKSVSLHIQGTCEQLCVTALGVCL